MLKKLNAFDKIENLVKTNLQKIGGMKKPQIKFFVSLVTTWIGQPVRYTILNLSRFGKYSEKSIRLHMERFLDFMSFNITLIQTYCGKECIAAFDPSYVPKSGKQTPGLDYWWSGKDQRTLKGLEIGCLSIIDVVAQTAMSLWIKQTPSKDILQQRNQNLVGHYLGVIREQLTQWKSLVKYLAVDGYL